MANNLALRPQVWTLGPWFFSKLDCQNRLPHLGSMAMTKASKKNSVFVFFYAIFVLAFIYFFPRAIVSLFGQESPWSSYFYQYGLGSLFFVTGIILITKTKGLRVSRGHDRKWLRYMWVGLACYAAIHAWWILLALHYPVKGGI